MGTVRLRNKTNKLDTGVNRKDIHSVIGIETVQSTTGESRRLSKDDSNIKNTTLTPHDDLLKMPARPQRTRRAKSRPRTQVITNADLANHEKEEAGHELLSTPGRRGRGLQTRRPP